MEEEEEEEEEEDAREAAEMVVAVTVAETETETVTPNHTQPKQRTRTVHCTAMVLPNDLCLLLLPASLAGYVQSCTYSAHVARYQHTHTLRPHAHTRAHSHASSHYPSLTRV